MTLCDAVKDFGPKVTTNYRDTRYCSFAPPEETIGVIDLSAASDGSRGIAFLTDRMLLKLGSNIEQVGYRDIRVMEILPSYETPFQDELSIGAPTGSIRISDCALNKFFLRQLISTVCRMSITMREPDRQALLQQLAAEAHEHFPEAAQIAPEPKPQPAPHPVRIPEAAAAVSEIAAAKKAALAEAQPSNPIEITEEKIQWLSGARPSEKTTENPADKPAAPQKTSRSDNTAKPEAPSPAPLSKEESIEDMSREQTMSFLLDSIAEINSQPAESTPAQPEKQPQPVPAGIIGEKPAPAAPSVPPIPPVPPVPDMPPVPPAPPVPDTPPVPPVPPAPPVPDTPPIPPIPPAPPAPDTPPVSAETAPPEPPAPSEPVYPWTKEPDSPDIYIQASRKLRELCDDGKLTMEQINTAVREQLVPASETYSALDPESSPLPEAVKKRARQLAVAADCLNDYFALGEDIAARVMFFMLYQMLSYTDRIVQSDDTKQRLNYFFVRFGAAGIVLSMLDANN